jgi:hypothetical protein
LTQVLVERIELRFRLIDGAEALDENGAVRVSEITEIVVELLDL